MKLTETGNKARTQEKINADIVANMTGDGNKVEAVKTETATFFDAEGKLQIPTDYTVTFVPADIE
ncbi:MAG: hypothetical protein WCL18_04645 [bacterium]